MKLIEALEILRKARTENAEGLPVFLACGFTPLHLQTLIAAHLQQRFPHRQVQVETGLYGDCLNSLQRSAEIQREASIVVLEWADLDPRLGLRRLSGWSPTDLPDILNTVAMRVAQFEHSLRRAAEIAPVALALPTLPFVPVSYTPGWQASVLELSLQEILFKMAATLAEKSNLRVISRQSLDYCSPLKGRLDVKSALRIDFPYSLTHADALANLLVQAAIPPMPLKGLITDLDNTLWRGIIGEVGASGISWDLDHHSQIHGLYQQLLRSLADAGILIAIASKNTSEFADEGLRRSDLLLPLDKVFPIEIAWGPKSEAVTHILQSWNIGPDSVVFVDDSPMELAEVQSAHPGVLALRFPHHDEQAAYELFEKLRTLLGKSVLTREDTLRIESLRSAYQRTTEAPIVAENMEDNMDNSQDAFLQQIEADLTVTFIKDPPDPRALELINKTNQFNLNGKRYTEGRWQTYLKQPETTLMLVSYADKYGPLGKIAVLAGQLDGKRFVVESWVMSCRAFSRRIEHKCLQLLFDTFAVEELVFDYLATARNGPVHDFLKDILGNPPETQGTLSVETFRCNCPPTFFKDKYKIHL